MVSPVLFWVVALLTVIPSLALLFARKAVHIAMSIVCVMVGLAAAYVGLGAPFLGVVQIVVYTGAVMMLFLFVLMLVGVDQREDLKETLRGQRWIALFTAGGLAILLISVIGRVSISPQEEQVGNPEDIALVLFDRYVLVMEVLGALLITAAVGALVMTHTPRLLPRKTQAEVHAARVLAGADPVNKPMPGVYARHNALDVPALDPDGNPIEHSVSRVLEVREQMSDGDEFRARLESTANPEDHQNPQAEAEGEK
ncbi:NADH-quinone oxidoreductase subunit J [Demequina sp. NBRC 110056]|uniref:NADH-quinone oxidoreductase subunit J n=1 Tax=Demequina sp. NBRC 110056 TaxID=1570345 RepID=UPI00117CDE33|nr:NADH-quinone oxidoreductase subunit J [Demequina sp. NBRC 110056]